MLQFFKLIGSLIGSVLNFLGQFFEILDLGLPTFISMMGVLPRVVFSTVIIMCVIAVIAAILGRIKN